MTRKLLNDGDDSSVSKVPQTGTGDAPEAGSNWRTLLVIQPRSKIRQHIVPAAHGYAFEIKASSHFRIVDLHGQQVVDFMAWALPYNTGAEHFSASYTRYALGGLAPPRAGESLYTNRDRRMFTLVDDTVKTHDSLFMACNPGFYARQGEPGHRSCATNMAEAMAPWGMKHWSEVIDPFNVFQNTPYYTLKGLNCSKPGDYVEMKAEMDAVCSVSSCPFERDGFNGGKATEIAVVFEEVEDEAASEDP
ncbi:hypothetical protein H2202_005205 [Exophiala xenobiotica]|nr:hypothetical protein H2202_005205 [Exophiala xenobiotica]KAK5214232.1 hypothetical protein LTR41_000424 [Exophiala xenobiotica]KAK5227010.1 hypothetical protein LTR72_003000 [Exophiala xenobiotica]KAK5234510.1 hypothetical protein LTR47_004544 [Exophiala xenobiotica]KAK5280196.1 hypothetical protein LTR40_006705 [Exophiala xenobiotica]